MGGIRVRVGRRVRLFADVDSFARFNKKQIIHVRGTLTTAAYDTGNKRPEEEPRGETISKGDPTHSRRQSDTVLY